jgi:hypothetical protein
MVALPQIEPSARRDEVEHSRFPIPDPPSYQELSSPDLDPITDTMLPEVASKLDRFQIQKQRLESQRQSLISDYRDADARLKYVMDEAIKIAQIAPPSYSFSEAEICVVNNYILCEVTKLDEQEASVEVISLLDDYSEYSTNKSMMSAIPRHVQRDIRTLRRDKSRIQKLLDGISRELVPTICEIENIHDESRIHYHRIANDGSVDVDSEIQRIRLEMENMLMQRKDLYEKKRYFKQLLLMYHPDKRNYSSDVDGQLFKYIQDSKDWFWQS